MSDFGAVPGSYFLEWSAVQEGDCILRNPASPPGWLWFRLPRRIISATALHEVTLALTEVEAESAGGATCVGLVAYEAGPAFDPAVSAYSPNGRPLVWFAVFDDPPTWHRELAPCETLDVCEVDPLWSELDYQVRFERVHAALEDGEAYQVNLTFPIGFSVSSGAELFASRCGVNPPPFASLLVGEDWQVASFSPELFFERVGDEVEMRPMKGTARAGDHWMPDDPKSVAENVMIVDMVRNDLGTICDVGSISTPSLMEVERHGGLLQMISRVRGRTSVPLSRLMGALFPPASVTGAPKVAATWLIRDLESTARGVYCGAIGVASKGFERFAVGIRTAWVSGGLGEFGVGSGVVWDSKAGAEYAECLLKAERLVQPGNAWRLIESLPAHGLDRPEVHLARLRSSSEELGIPVDSREVERALSGVARSLPEERVKVRVAVARDGQFKIEKGASALTGSRLTAVMGSSRVDSRDPNLRHKTNSRAVFDEALAAYPNADEVLLLNERGQLAEFCRGNILLEIDGLLLTPPPSDGCLAGIGVGKLIKEGKAEYRSLSFLDLKSADRVWFCNSVVGLIEVDLDLG